MLRDHPRLLSSGLSHKTHPTSGVLREALPIRKEGGHRAGQSIVRYNMAMIYREQGKLEEAVKEFRKVVDLDELVESPNLESDTALLT